MTTSPSKQAHKQIPFFTYLSLTALVIWLLLRVVLWLQVGPAQLSFGQFLHTFALGLWFDLSALAYLVVPFVLISILLPNRWRTNKWVKMSRWLLVWLVTFALLFGAVSEFIFWQEFTTRFNFIAVDYLIYTNEVIGNIRESYPVPLILLIIASAALAIILLAGRYVSFQHEAYTRKKKLAFLVSMIILPILSFKLANVDQMQVGTNAYASELSGNGVFSISAAMRRNELDYDKFYKTIPADEAAKVMASVGANRTPTTQAVLDVASMTNDDASTLGPFSRRPKNVVLISVESLSAEYMGIFGSKDNLTPKLDAIAKQGLVFDKLFATGTRTVRGLDSLTIAIPPIPGQAVVHRPNNNHLAGIGEFLKAQDFATYWIYGGYGVFDNMNNYFKSNDYKVVDRTDFDAKSIGSENVWGVADESLFNNSLKVFDDNTKLGKPFFAHIMTTSNHRPFTFPDGRVDLPQGHRDGAVKYTDYAIAKFLEDAKSKPWFKDTLFVIVADHCASVAGKTKLPVAKYHIPLIFYAPDMLRPGHYDRVASQIDIVPTLLDVLGVKGSEHFYAQSMFKAQAEKAPQRAFISNYQELGYYKDGTLIVLSPKRRTEAFKVDPVTLDSSPIAVNPTLLNEAIAYYQTASRAFKQGELKAGFVK
ncbi:MAG: sulfatase-like hydrolase/transferase [Methylophilaceae bacterium]|nr:sulfatase-like hydrolase/transferase [Methylophilaceae bacterium]